MQCYFCRKNLEIHDRVGRQHRCPFCSQDLHICKNCEFYDRAAYNECSEPQAERVLDKEKSNFCDYFLAGRGGSRTAPTDPAAEAKKKLEELFKK